MVVIGRNEKALTVRSALSFSRHEIRAFAPRFFALLAGWVGVWFVVEALVIGTGTLPGRPIWLIVHLSYFLGTSFFEAAIIDLSLAARDRRNPRTVDSLRDLSLAVRFTIVKLILLPFVLSGLALLLLPGAFLLGRFGYVFFDLVDQRAGIAESLRENSKSVKGILSRLMWISLVFVLFNLTGAALLGVGLLFTLPMTALAVGFIYRAMIPAGGYRRASSEEPPHRIDDLRDDDRC